MVSNISAERATSATVDTPRTPTGRKRPFCTKCGKPMLGHKRGQCNTESAPSKFKEGDADKAKSRHELTQQLADLHIDEREPENEDVVIGKKPRKVDTKRRSSAILSKLPKAETLASLTSNEKGILDGLGKSGMMSKGTVINESVARSQIERWLESVPAPESTKGTRESSHDFDAMLDLAQKRDVPAKRRSAMRSARSLGRTSSAVEREEFFEQLAQKSKKPVARVFTVDMKDIKELEENAKRLKLHARIIAPKYADGCTGDGWLVVGKDENSVKEMFAEVERELKKGVGCMSRLGHIAAGAVIAWTYLAFS